MIGVVIVNYNSGPLLTQCLQHLSAQSLLPNKVIIVDNDSDDRSLANLPKGCNPNIIRLNENVGFAAANNLAFKELVDTEYIVLLNPDALVEPDWLQQMLAATANNPEYSFFACRQLKAENYTQLDGDGDVYHVSGLAWREGYGGKTTKVFAPQEVFSPCAAAAMYRTEVILAVGGFDKDYFCYFEDVDLGFRLRLVGYRCLLVPKAVVHHYGSASTGGQHSDFSVYYGHRNLVWTYVKNMPGVLFWLFLPYHLLLNIFSVIWFTAQGQGRVIIKAKVDAIRAIPEVWKKRSNIQAERKVSLFKILRVMDKAPVPKFLDLIRWR